MTILNPQFRISNARNKKSARLKLQCPFVFKGTHTHTKSLYNGNQGNLTHPNKACLFLIANPTLSITNSMTTMGEKLCCNVMWVNFWPFLWLLKNVLHVAHTQSTLNKITDVILAYVCNDCLLWRLCLFFKGLWYCFVSEFIWMKHLFPLSLKLPENFYKLKYTSVFIRSWKVALS